MKADVSKLDWIEVGDEPIRRRRRLNIDSGRRATRVEVGLPVAIGTKGRAYLTRSIDISETGILVSVDHASNFKAGDRVRVLIKGILSDSGRNEQLMTMRVVRVDGDRDEVALRFYAAAADKPH